VSLARLQECGFRVVIFPISTLLVTAQAIAGILAVIKQKGTPATAMDRMTPFHEFINFLGMPEIRDLETRFASRSDFPTTRE
jgi:2-methylisocitrate lyase-like PEP mutase family enzyme